MAITLDVADAGDGTGVVATVAGSGGGSTNTLTKATWTGTPGTLTFSAGGNRTGDGTISVSVSSGMYLWKLTNSDGTSVYNFQPATGGETASVIYRIMLAVQSQIQALSLTGISSSNVKVRWLPRDINSVVDAAPQVVICPAPLPEKEEVYTTGTDHIGYPVLVACIHAQNMDNEANIARDTLWREKIRREFINQGLVSVPEVAICKVEPQAQINPAWFDANSLYSAQIFRFQSRELRGN